MIRANNLAFGNRSKAPKNAKGSKTNYNTEANSANNSYLKSNNLTRQNKNRTQSQQKQMYKTLEGVVVNNFIKDNKNTSSVSMNDICTSLVIPDEFNKNAYSTPVTQKEKKIEKKSTVLRSAFPLAAISLIATGGILGLTALMKKSASSLNDPKILRRERLPNLGMNMNIKQEHEFGAYMALRNPNKKTILAMIGIFLMSGLTLLGKNLVDGVQEIWVKKKEADANKKLQEGLIDIETRAFAGKLDVINEELVDKANYFKSVLNSLPDDDCEQNAHNNISMTANSVEKQNPFLGFFGITAFKGKKNVSDVQNDVNKPILAQNTTSYNDNSQKEENFENSSFVLAGLTIGTLALGLLMGKKMFKNFTEADSEVRKYVQNETKLIENRISALSKNIKKATSKDDAVSDLADLKNLLQIKRADSIETRDILKQFKFLSKQDIDDATNEVMVGIKSIYGDAPETLGGRVGQIQYYCYLDEARGHIYNWIMNPDNPFARYLFLALTTVNAAGYSIRKAVEGIKEAAVISENKNTEKELEERLIDTEIRNFKSKKQSAIEPMMKEFNTKLNSGATKEELKTMADNILLEIKNGPPFVYA